MNASRSKRGAAKSNEVSAAANATEKVKTKETRGRKAVTKAVSPPPTERPTRATRSSTRVTRKSVIEEVPEEKPTKPEVRPTRGRKGRSVVSKQTENSTESETEKPDPPKRGLRRKAAEPVVEKPPKEAKAEKAKPSKPATTNPVTAATTTTNTTNATTTTSTSKPTRGRGTKRSAAVAAATAIDLSEIPDEEEEEAPKPKRATRARSTTTTKEKPAAKPARTGTRTSTRGRKKEPTPEPEPEPEPAPVAEVKESEQVPEQPKEEPVRSQPALDKIEEETDSMVANDKTNREPEILPTVVDVIEGIKEQVERTIDEIKESELDDTVPIVDTKEEKESAADDASSIAETRDSLDVNLDNNSVRDIPDDELKSIDDKSSDKSNDEKTSDETLANDISISDTENEKTSEIGAFKGDQIVPNASLENGERDVCKTSGDSKTISNDKSVNDTVDDIDLDETLPMESLNDKNGEITKRKTDDLEEDEHEEEAERATIAKQKQVKKPRTHLLDLPDIPSISGQVMTFGDDMCGELGLGETGLCKKRPALVKDVNEKVVHIASGGMHNVCLTSDGHVYTWGCNDEGALGRETPDIEDRDLSAEPTKVPLPYKIVKVSAGDSHSAALTSTGSIYVWGNFKDSNGKIGLTCDSKEGQITPIQIDISNTTFVDLASGNDHLLLLTDTGDIYSIGVGEQGQLGRIPAEEMKEIKEKKEIFLKPSLVKFDESIACDRIWAGQYSSYARTKTGEIFAWGLNNYSQLGVPVSSLTSDDKTDLTVPFPLRVPSFAKFEGLVEQICPGQHFMLARDSKGKVYSCGRHEYGRLGHGKQDESYDEPKLIESFDKVFVTHIAAGSVTSFAVSEKGDLYAWGMNGAALGLSDEDAWTPTLVEAKSLEPYKVISVAAGSQHTAIIVQPKNE